ncbi:hypothetical protein AB0M43_23870 [Longispora sp. NPDC051575]|uniref:hypothetical protein n=1 Tax=Longispora sp. NPDC051575 TaxID=3154943 RepID=UPI00343FC762
MTRTTRRVLAGAIVVLILCLAGALVKPTTDTDLHHQAVAEMHELVPAWGTTEVTISEPVRQRHASIGWRTVTTGDDPHPVSEAVQRAHEHGWQDRQCGSETCLYKGQYNMQIEPAPCTAGSTGDCGLAVTISWTRPLAAWRPLAIVATLVVGTVGLYLIVARARSRDTTGEAG